MSSIELGIRPEANFDFGLALGGLIEIGKISLAVGLLGGIFAIGIKKMVSGGKK